MVFLEDVTLLGSAQKTIVYGNTVFQFAGYVQPAYQVANRLYELSSGGTKYVPLSKVLLEFNFPPAIASNLALFTAFYGGPTELLTCANFFEPGMLQKGIYEHSITGAGTGFGETYRRDFLSGLAKMPLQKDVSLEIDLIYRLTQVIIEPWFGGLDTLTLEYGSWFEYTILDQDCFRKRPIAVKFWPRLPGEKFYSAHGPLVFSQYINHDLIIYTARANSSDRTMRHIIAPDPLGRGRAANCSEHDFIKDSFKFDPEIMIHVLFDIAENDYRNFKILPLLAHPQASYERGAGMDVTLTFDREGQISGADHFVGSKVIEMVNEH